MMTDIDRPAQPTAATRAAPLCMQSLYTIAHLFVVLPPYTMPIMPNTPIMEHVLVTFDHLLSPTVI